MVISNANYLNRKKGILGELKTRFIHKNFLDPKVYHIFNKVFIQLKSRSFQVDHIIVSKFGIFVIETKYRSGWVYGGVDDENWTVTYPRQFQMQNPLHQNNLHISCLADYLGISRKTIFSIVVFWGEGHFETKMPNNVIYGDYSKYIINKEDILFSDQQVEDICTNLLQLQIDTPFGACNRYIDLIKQLHLEVI